MFSALVDFIFPKTCVICGRVDTWLCPNCQPKLVLAGDRPIPGGLAGLTCLYSYRNKAVKKVISAIKYDFLPEVIEAVVTESALPKFKFDAITYVPLHRRRQNWRGFNQAEKLARWLTTLTKIPTLATLERIKYTMPLVKTLSSHARKQEIEGAFRLKQGIRIKGQSLVLVDDVFTSGATMLEAASVLSRAGARQIWGWALAG